MKKITTLLLSIILVFVLEECGNSAEQNMSDPATETSSTLMEETDSSALTMESETPDQTSEQKILVAYYSLSGNTEHVAQRLQALTGGELYEIELETPYTGNTTEISERATHERETGDYPTLKGSLPDLFEYDIVFIGGPVWSRTLSSPLIAFLDQLDFNGKTVAPFWTDAGTSGDYEVEFRNYLTTESAEKGVGISSVSSLENTEIDQVLDEWLNELNVAVRQEESTEN